MDRDTRLAFWKTVGDVNPDVIAPIINPAFNSNLPKWPSLEQSYITLKKPNGNTVIATDGLSSHFDPAINSNAAEDVNGFELELYIETDEQLVDIAKSYQFDLIYQMALQVANSGGVRKMLDKYGMITTELYDVNVPAEFINADGRVGVILGLTSPDVADTLQLSSSIIKIVNVKLLTLNELKYVAENGSAGREYLKNLFAQNSSTVSNLTRQSVI